MTTQPAAPPPLLPLVLCLLCACSATKPLKGGRALTAPAPAGGLAQSLSQSQNPSQLSRQTQDTIHTRTYSVPPPIPPAPQHSITPPFHSPSPQLLTEIEETHATTELGAAQKDTTRELTAKLSSLKGIVWVGLGLFIFGLASLFWLPLKTIIGSLTTSIAITLGGLALIILPTLIVGNELLILCGVALAVGAWFLAHRHGHLRGQVTALNTAQ